MPGRKKVIRKNVRPSISSKSKSIKKKISRIRKKVRRL